MAELDRERDQSRIVEVASARGSVATTISSDATGEECERSAVAGSASLADAVGEAIVLPPDSAQAWSSWPQEDARTSSVFECALMVTSRFLSARTGASE